MAKKGLSIPNRDQVSRALTAWPILLAAALIGALLGAAMYQLNPPPYRTEARVVLDQNLEAAVPVGNDRDVFYFLERETQKLEELAWSDTVLAKVSEKVGFASISELRGGMLQLSQPHDGGWRFYGINKMPGNSKELAAAWVEAFTSEVRSSVAASIELESIRAELAAFPAGTDPATLDRRTFLEQQAADLENASHGIHPFAQVSISQKKDLPTARIIGMGPYLFAGAMSALFIVLVILMISGEVRESNVDE